MALVVVEHVRIDLPADCGSGGASSSATEQRTHERSSEAAED
ncbi:hypothetical protein PQR25_30520 [Paraburkholderia nemoris]